MFVRSAPTEREKQTSLRSYEYLAPTEPGNILLIPTDLWTSITACRFPYRVDEHLS